MNKPLRFVDQLGIYVRVALSLAIGGCLLVTPKAQAGWTALSTTAPDSVDLMILLPDGTVMAADAYTSGGSYGIAWYRLTPDGAGHYVNGAWTTRAPATYTRLWCSTAVLQNGKVIVAGGEYGTGGSTAELYDPISDSWSNVTVPAGSITTGTFADGTNKGFRDSMCAVLPNGNVIIAPNYPTTANATLIYDYNANSLSVGPAYLASQNEAGWVKLPDGSILTVNKQSLNAERFIPSQNKWISDANVPVALFDSFGAEEGPAFLLPNSKVIFFGGNGNTAIYTPSGTTNNGSWVTGPSIPSGQAMADAGGCMMVNGKILIAVATAPSGSSSALMWPPPVYFYEYDYASGATGSYTQVASPTGGLSDNIPSYQAIMLALPDGNVLYSDFSSQLYVYTPTSGPLAAGKPTIYNVTPNSDGSYHVTGTLFNGISQGAAYGDDAQMDTDFPLIRLTDGGGNVSYARPYNWSDNTVMTGGTTVSTEFTGQAFGLFPGNYSLQVVANGIASDPVSFTGPVWVDFAYAGFFQFGTYDLPDKTLAGGISQVASGGTINIKPGTSTETFTKITKAMEIRAYGGPVKIGAGH